MNHNLTPRLVAAALAASALLAFSSCSTATVKDVWTAPGVTNISFKKILVLAATKDGTARRTFEDSVVASVPQITAIPSYSYLAGQDLSNTEQIAVNLTKEGFDGIVVMRLISDRSELNVSSGGSYPMGYGSFRGYYGGYAYGGFSTTTVTTDRILSIETNIYDVAGDKLIWSGVTESTSPGNIKQMVEDAAGAIKKQMVKQGLIPAPVKK